MKKNTLYLARGGILTALGFILVYLSTILPTSRLSVLVLASFLIPASILITNIQTTITVYFATSIISIIFLGFRGPVIAYVFIFGIYGLIKLFIEKLRNIPLEIMLKTIYFNSMLGIIYFISQGFLSVFAMDSLKDLLPFPLIVVALNLLFFLFDYVVTEFIKFFLQKIYPKIK